MTNKMIDPCSHSILIISHQHINFKLEKTKQMHLRTTNMRTKNEKRSIVISQKTNSR